MKFRLIHLNIIFALLFSLASADDDKAKQPRLKITDTSNYFIVVSSRDSSLSSETANQSSTTRLFGKSEIDSYRKEGLSELANSLPGLNYAGGTSRPRFFQLRGIGERELFEGIPSNSVRIIYDEMDFSGISSAVSLFDIDEAAALYGPQSFSVGPAAYAGAVSLHSADPTDYSTGRAQISGGTNDSFEGGLAAGGKLLDSDYVKYRFSVNKNYVNGFRRNTFLDRDDTNQRDGTGARIKLEFDFSESTKGELMYLFADIRDGYDAFTIDNDLSTESDRPGVDTQRTNAVKFKLTDLFGAGSKLTNTLVFTHTLQQVSYDVDFGNENLWSPYNPYDYTQDYHRAPRLFSHELKYSSGQINPLVQGDSVLEAGSFSAYRGDRTSTDDYFTGQLQNTFRSRFKVYDFSPIARYQYTLLPRWVADLGGRIENRRLEFEDSRGFDKSGSELLPGMNLSLRNYKDDKAADYYYGSVSLGTKPGGVNPGLSSLDERSAFDSERLWNFEAGTNDVFYEGDLKTKLALFYGLRKSQQVRAVSQPDPSSPSSFLLLTENAASGNLYGADAEAVLRVSEKFRIRLNGELLRTNIYDFNSPSGSLNGRDQSHAPNWSYSASGNYALTDNIYIGSRITGKAAFYFDEPNSERSTPYHLIDAYIGYTTGRWTMELWGRNIFDERYQNKGYYFGSEPPDFKNKRYVQLGDPAWFGITARYDW